MSSKYKKRLDGRYCTHVVIGVKTDGMPLRKTVYAKTVRELEEKAAELRRQVSTGTVIKDENITVANWALEWMKTYKSGVEYNTQEMYRVAINTHIIPAIGYIKLKDIRPHHLQRLVNDKSAQGLTRAVEKIALTLKQIFKKGVENNLIIKNPSLSIELPKREKIKKRALTDDEKSYIKRADLDLKSRAFLYVLLYAGLRRGEALSLTRKDINFKDKTISVYKTLITKGNTPEIKPSPKSKSGNRVIPMPGILSDCLADLLREGNSIYIFTSAAGEIMSKNAFRCFWDKIIRRLNIAAGGKNNLRVLASDITPHTFRHDYATTLYYAGVDIKTAQYLLGHSTINMTMEVYTHLDSVKTMAAADKINVYLSGSQEVVSSHL